MIKVGTCNFVNMQAAANYYGERLAKQKLEEGEIKIGKPDLKPGQRLEKIVSEGRYVIVFDEEV